MSDTKALCDVVSAALDHHGNAKAQDAFEALMGRLRAAESMSECRSGKIGRLEEEVKTQFAMRQNSSEMCKALKAELDAEHARAQRAEADNAALRETATKILYTAIGLHELYRASSKVESDGSHEASFKAWHASLKESHPGAALLEELEGLRRNLGTIANLLGFAPGYETSDGLLAAVDARLQSINHIRENTLEEAAHAARTARHSVVVDESFSVYAKACFEIERRIRALKKTGQGE